MRMQTSRSSLAISALALGALLALPAGSAWAKPKKINGCTIGQIQSQAASSCIAKMESDIMNNRPTTHAVYCSSTGAILCCEYDDAGRVVDHSRTVIGRSGAQKLNNAKGKFGVARN
ncbi:hypothetical protein FQ775_21945 [Nitratireductor mangrovi]|uniref:Uncharacterized protein n=1 Tax=Nitratireductor mangrovi TaxID=2599600 RepID=A0A5B8L4A7_9HYPH|nr:hypothetical protein [Nitratireductor mangrovi]QDZ02816.1 hypothetical protein FQ775_21945 [Nitratireductor mangrovi]